MGTIVITGAASGIGAATGARLADAGHTIVGVDLQGSDIDADLATPAGRTEMVRAVTDRTGGSIDGLVPAAGISRGPGELVASVNYFGAVATIEGLRPLLAADEGGAVVALSSNSVSTAPQLDGVADALLSGDEEAARNAAAADPSGLLIYPATKLALARWVRRQAVTEAWIGAGIRLNAIAPGFIDTPMTAGGWDFVQTLGDAYPVPAGRPGTPTEIAALIDYLLGPDAGFFVGSLLYCDGGTDAAMRADDWPTAP